MENVKVGCIISRYMYKTYMGKLPVMRSVHGITLTHTVSYTLSRCLLDLSPVRLKEGPVVKHFTLLEESHAGRVVLQGHFHHPGILRHCIRTNKKQLKLDMSGELITSWLLAASRLLVRGRLDTTGLLVRGGLDTTGLLVRGGLDTTGLLVRGGLDTPGLLVRGGLDTTGLVRGGLDTTGLLALSGESHRE